MLLIAGFFLLFLLAGLAFVAFSDRDDDVLLAPAAGFAGSLLLAYFLSANFRLSGGVSYAIAAGTLAVAGPILCVARGRGRALAIAGLRGLPFLLPGFVLLIPAMTVGPATFFGSVNFDFFSNSQDGVFLANASYHAPSPTRESGIVPLVWSTGEGKFAASLVSSAWPGAAASGTLSINAQLLCALVLTQCFAVAGLARAVLGLRGVWAVFAVAACVLSAGYALGQFYFLLGQTSGAPVFALCLALAQRLLARVEAGEDAGWRAVLPSALAANALYAIYPVLAVFFAGIFCVALALAAGAVPKRAMRVAATQLAIAGGIFVLLRAGTPEAILESLRYWIGAAVSAAEGGDSIQTDQALVFTDYATEAAFALFSGLVTYPTSASWWQDHLPDAPMRGAALSIAGLMASGLMAASVAAFAPRSKGAEASRALILALGLVAGAALAAFLATRATYALFKISTWFAPLLLPLFVAPWRVAQGRARRIAPLLALGGWAVIALNGAATWRYLSAFADPRAPNPFVNAPGLSGPGIGELAQAIRALPGARVHFALPNPFETAWLANALRDRDMVALAQNDQVLALVKNFADPCGRPPPPLGSGLLVVAAPDSPAVDIVPPPRGPAPLAAAGQWRVLAAADVDLLVFVGRGAYPATPLEPAVARAIGFPERLRWVERHFEIWIHSRVARIADVDIELVPGYVAAPLARRYVTTVDGVARTHELRGLETRIALEGVALRAGYTCVSIASPDAVARQARHGALFRADLPVDGRFLNFAAGPIGVRPRD